MNAPARIASDVEDAVPRADGGRARLLAWLTCWLVLPNLPYLPVTLIGGPPRFQEILVCATVGVLVRGMRYGVRLAAFVAMIAWMLASFIAHMFNMHISMLLSVIGLVADIQPAVSPEYVAGAAMLVGTVLLGAWMLRRDGNVSGLPWLACAIAASLALPAADFAMSRETRGSYDRVAAPGAAFSSATTQTDFLALADGKTHLMIVMVEAMGQPVDPRLQARLDRVWRRPELAGNYVISRGQTPYYGSTTSGEIRELCRRWGDYQAIRTTDGNCLPALLRTRGYETTSYHGFGKTFFDRESWYPRIGFEHMMFRNRLIASGASFCPNVFAGACDRDIPALIGRQLASADKPQFVYWLTLNSHLPIVENRALGTLNCNRLGARFDADFPMVCRLFSLWETTAEQLAKVVAQPGFPPTDILIVGDHMPPFTHQKSRLQFDPAHVPWVLLRHRRGDAAAHSAESPPGL